MIVASELILEVASPYNAELVYPDLCERQNYLFLEGEPPSLDEHLARHQAAQFHKSPDNPSMIWLYWIVRFRNCYVGTVEIGVFPHENYAEIGFMTFERFRRMGLATAFCSLAIFEFHKRFPSLVLHASVNELNVSCIKVLQKLGFECVITNINTEHVMGIETNELIFMLESKCCTSIIVDHVP